MECEGKAVKPIRVFNRTLHKELWTWLAEHPDCYKHDWPGWEKLTDEQLVTMLHNYMCFACFVAGNDDRYCDTLERETCEDCPLDWGGCCLDDGGLFDMYGNAQGIGAFGNVEEYARQIAELPLKENDNFITIVI